MTTIANFSASDLAREFLRTSFANEIDSIKRLYDLSRDRDALAAAARGVSGIEAIDEPTDANEEFVDDVEAAIVELINERAEEIAHAIRPEIESRAGRLTEETTDDALVTEAFDSMLASTCVDSWGKDIVRAVADCADVRAEDARA